MPEQPNFADFRQFEAFVSKATEQQVDDSDRHSETIPVSVIASWYWETYVSLLYISGLMQLLINFVFCVAREAFGFNSDVENSKASWF